MRWFEYGDEKISDKEIMIAVPSIAVGVGILSMPRNIAEATVSADGVVSLVVSGAFIVFFTWLVAKLASSFPQQSFLTYSSRIISKPIGIVLTFLLSVQGLMITAFEVRVIADVASKYLFSETPFEVIGLAFLLIVVYAVSGSRAGLFRLNMMFFPIIVFISILVVLFTMGLFEMDNVLPALKTDVSGYLVAFQESSIAYIGFGILLFYTVLVKKPKDVPKKASIGMSFAVCLYILFYVMCIGVFGDLATANLQNPTVELAKSVQIPGGFFERFESIFFVIWIMAIFNTSVMAMDAAVLALQSIFKNAAKEKMVFLLSPIIFFISMLPQNEKETSSFGSFIGYYGFSMTVSVTIILLTITKIRGVKSNE